MPSAGQAEPPSTTSSTRTLSRSLPAPSAVSPLMAARSGRERRDLRRVLILAVVLLVIPTCTLVLQLLEVHTGVAQQADIT